MSHGSLNRASLFSYIKVNRGQLPSVMLQISVGFVTRLILPPIYDTQDYDRDKRDKRAIRDVGCKFASHIAKIFKICFKICRRI